MGDEYTTKPQLRQHIKSLLSHLTEQEKKRESEEMIEKIIQFVHESTEVKIVASYAAMKDELNLDALHKGLPKLNFCYPKCSPEGAMDFYSVRNISEMSVSKYGIREPNESVHESVPSETIDLFLCPAYAYTSDGKRLGKGGGFYDRYLLRKRPGAMTLGISFSCQVIHCIPTSEHDLSVDHVF